MAFNRWFSKLTNNQKKYIAHEVKLLAESIDMQLQKQKEINDIFNTIFQNCVKEECNRELTIDETHDFLTKNKNKIEEYLKSQKLFMNNITIEKFKSHTLVNINNPEHLENCKNHKEELVKVIIKKCV